MSKAKDLEQLIAEQAPRPDERAALERVVDALDDTLSVDVPHVPAFRADLRRRLMAEARKGRRPWYRRPGVWGSGLVAVAAVGVLGLGLQMFRRPVQKPAPQVVQQPPAKPPEIQATEPPIGKQLVSSQYKVPVVLLPDQVAGPGDQQLDPSVRIDVSRGLPLMVLTGGPTQRSVSDIAVRLGFSAQVEEARGVFTVSQGTWRLEVAPDGKVVFTDASVTARSAGGLAGGVPTGGPEGAKAVARRFLDRAALPVPDAQPTVAEGLLPGTLSVVYLPQVEGRPVVNGRFVVTVGAQSEVVAAEAYLAMSQEPTAPYPAIGSVQALEQARGKGGGTFDGGADLVWARTPSEESVFLQPFWRLSGVRPDGTRIFRFVAVLRR